MVYSRSLKPTTTTLVSARRKRTCSFLTHNSTANLQQSLEQDWLLVTVRNQGQDEDKDGVCSFLKLGLLYFMVFSLLLLGYSLTSHLPSSCLSLALSLSQWVTVRSTRLEKHLFFSCPSWCFCQCGLPHVLQLLTNPTWLVGQQQQLLSLEPEVSKDFDSVVLSQLQCCIP